MKSKIKLPRTYLVNMHHNKMSEVRQIVVGTYLVVHKPSEVLYVHSW